MSTVCIKYTNKNPSKRVCNTDAVLQDDNMLQFCYGTLTTDLWCFAKLVNTLTFSYGMRFDNSKLLFNARSNYSSYVFIIFLMSYFAILSFFNFVLATAGNSLTSSLKSCSGRTKTIHTILIYRLNLINLYNLFCTFYYDLLILRWGVGLVVGSQWSVSQQEEIRLTSSILFFFFFTPTVLCNNAYLAKAFRMFSTNSFWCVL